MAEIPQDSKLPYVYLGNSGLRVANICLGCMTFGKSRFATGPSQVTDEAQAHAIINRYVEWGGNFLDTANVYGEVGVGNSERIVGSWLAGQERDRFVIATKCRFPMSSDDPNCVGLGRRHIIKSVEQSLERLKTDYIDLMQTHAWDDAVPLEETLRTLHDLVRCGKVRYVGASNVTGWQLQKIIDLNQQFGFNPIISLQQQYSLASRYSELEPFQVCKLNGIGVLPWSPLKGGFLTGKARRDQEPEKNSRIAYMSKNPKMQMEAAPAVSTIGTDKNWAMLDTIERIGKTKGKSMAQVSLRWLLQKPVVSSVIIGVTKMQHLDNNLGAGNGWTLTDEEMAELDEASKPDIPYPYNMIWRVNGDRKNPWNPSPYV